MRTVEKNIIREIQYGDNELNKNFSCRDRLEKTDYNQFKFYLWNNLIFYKSAKTNKYYFCMHGWESKTTKSRINAFLSGLVGKEAHIYTKNQQLFYSADGAYSIKINASERYEIQNNGSLKKIENIMNVL